MACRHETAPGQWQRFGVGRIVARFGGEGKPDRARKSRIFNNLGSAPMRRLAGRYYGISATIRRRSGPSLAARRPCGTRRGYDSHSPRQRHFRPYERIQTKTGLRSQASGETFMTNGNGAPPEAGPSPAERAGAVHQGPVVRESERAGLAGAAAAAAGDQHPDQRQRQQSRRKRVRSDAFGRGQGRKRRQGDVQLRSRLCRRVPDRQRAAGKPASAGHDRMPAAVVPVRARNHRDRRCATAGSRR